MLTHYLNGIVKHPPRHVALVIRLKFNVNDRPIVQFKNPIDMTLDEAAYIDIEFAYNPFARDDSQKIAVSGRNKIF